jgi:hypothetical protein
MLTTRPPKPRSLELCSLILWNKVFVEKLLAAELVKKRRPFYETRSFVTALTTSGHFCPYPNTRYPFGVV